MTKRCLMTICFALLSVGAGLTQETSASKTADNGPNLEVSMKFIQEKLNEQGAVGYVTAHDDGLKDVFTRAYVLVSDVVADSSTCTLYAKKKTTFQAEGTGDTPIFFHGKRYNGHMEEVDASTTPFKVVDSITVEPLQDAENRQFAEAAHPEITFTYTPAVFELMLKGAKNPDWLALILAFRDEETASRVAKALVHAVELCGGGSQSEPF